MMILSIKNMNNITRREFKQFFVTISTDGEPFFNISGGGGELPTRTERELIIKNLQALDEMGENNIYEHNSLVDNYSEIKYQERYLSEQVAPESENGFIYILHAGGYYKIGRTRFLTKRYRKYITENPEDIEVVLQEKVTDQDKAEALLHETFKSKVFRGEWFSLSNDDITRAKDTIKELIIN
jgi:coenzyme F420-reducing hydrogenase alpha subunit